MVDNRLRRIRDALRAALDEGDLESVKLTVAMSVEVLNGILSPPREVIDASGDALFDAMVNATRRHSQQRSNGLRLVECEVSNAAD